MSEHSKTAIAVLIGVVVTAMAGYLFTTLGAGREAAQKALILEVVQDELQTDAGVSIKTRLTQINERTIRIEAALREVLAED